VQEEADRQHDESGREQADGAGEKELFAAR
jgi:hypothetical protein